MGCQLGKLAASERRSNNQVLTDGPPPATDPRLPLTAKQKYSMLASWKGISRAMEKTGICMFIKTCWQCYQLIHLQTKKQIFEEKALYVLILFYR
ncbi:unnamed protein product [Euphydryas editha]|uniref:Neuroglobin-2 n=1 Tax=Euphydryas editha TaxID=104508 RepID=A0AAU9TWD2_EUPED|nr:unnamed protein product [Euphydryas editha]